MDVVERLRLRIHTSEDETALTDEAADEIERLREALRLAGDRVARLAYKMPPPNEFAPQFVLLGLTIASEALKGESDGYR